MDDPQYVWMWEWVESIPALKRTWKEKFKLVKKNPKYSWREFHRRLRKIWGLEEIRVLSFSQNPFYQGGGCVRSFI